ncbi:mevalonate kinase isoform X2 [Denticeps clupeoides]|uniref:mevalonate kinase isoform X2 n=1 Tax=Denticeps clupeoides TaxID=299321 RepID=UPI0010A3CAE1|nr:mevalonate kinase isoform X2 [Denticeps clupeoides]
MAPGKAILHGEHAVVHGKVALAVSLNLRTFLRLQTSSSGKVCINLPNIHTFLSWDLTLLQPLLPENRGNDGNVQELDPSLMKKLREFTGIAEGSTDTQSMAVFAFLYLYLSVFAKSPVLPSMTVAVWSELPTGAGLGSSAAFCVCVAAALLSTQGTISSPQILENSTARWSVEELELVNQLAFQGEKIIHGNPSGVDNAVSTWGGILRYHAGKMTPLERVPVLRILLTNTKVPRSTKTLVAGVKDKINKFPTILIPVLESVDAVSCKCEEILADMATCSATAEHYSMLEELIDINQHHLNVMGVGHPSLDVLCRATLARGLHSKLTGAGGGGCGITLLRPETDCCVIHSTIQDLKAFSYECWETSIGAPGVQLHSSAFIRRPYPEQLPKSFCLYSMDLLEFYVIYWTHLKHLLPVYSRPVLF